MSNDTTLSAAMPTFLKALIGLLAVGIAFDLVMSLVGGGSATIWVRLGLGVGCIIGLVRGHEGIRTALQGLAGVGIVIGAIAVIRVLALSPAVPMSGLLMLSIAAASLSLLISGFMFWVLGRHDVQAWMLRRSVGAI